MSTMEACSMRSMAGIERVGAHERESVRFTRGV